MRGAKIHTAKFLAREPRRLRTRKVQTVEEKEKNRRPSPPDVKADRPAYKRPSGGKGRERLLWITEWRNRSYSKGGEKRFNRPK